MDANTQTTMIEFIRYNNWANQKVLQACLKLTGDQLAQPIPGAYGSIHATLGHLIAAEAGYLEILTGSAPPPPFKWEDRPALPDIAAYAEQLAEAMLAMAERIQPTDQVVEEDQGQQFRYQAVALFIQIIDHGIEHRTNITTVLNQGLLAPPDIDGWAYLEAHSDRLGYDVTAASD
jgi:uncharacterized damage-inducible protein DinB